MKNEQSRNYNKWPIPAVPECDVLADAHHVCLSCHRYADEHRARIAHPERVHAEPLALLVECRGWSMGRLAGDMEHVRLLNDRDCNCAVCVVDRRLCPFASQHALPDLLSGWHHDLARLPHHYAGHRPVHHPANGRAL